MGELGGTIVKAISGFYDVETDAGLYRCKPRGLFRKQNLTPLVGDHVILDVTAELQGVIREIRPRKNEFLRPAVANIDQLVIFASEAIPVTDPFLIDRVIAIAERKGCEPILCINKMDLSQDRRLYDIYRKSGFQTLNTSAVTGEGIEALRAVISHKTCAFTGNSGVGKSSVLNMLEPGFALQVGDVSEKLGRGRHTTRHVEMFRLSCGAAVVDTPGFSSFDTTRMELSSPEELQYAFRDFAPYLGKCRFDDCRHLREPGCAVLEAVAQGEIQPSRYESYVRLYDQLKQIPDWERKSES